MILSAEQRAIQLAARTFAEREILPNVRAWEAAGGAPRELYREMAAIGLMGVTIDPFG